MLPFLMPLVLVKCFHMLLMKTTQMQVDPKKSYDNNLYISETCLLIYFFKLTTLSLWTTVLSSNIITI